VYRNLRLLQRSGLVRCRKLPNGESVYAPLERDDHHLTCVSCGHSEPLPICPVGSGGLGLSKVLLQGFKPLFHTFEIHGLCRSCQQSEPLAHG
jgi:Fur family ferric uptake transcriptional regulator